MIRNAQNLRAKLKSVFHTKIPTSKERTIANMFTYGANLRGYLGITVILFFGKTGARDSRIGLIGFGQWITDLSIIWQAEISPKEGNWTWGEISLGAK